MSEIQNIQWFPGHMTKTKRQIQASLKLVDAVAEILDARIPLSSKNPDLQKLIQNKPKVVLLNKCDISWKSNYNGTSGYLVTGPNGNTIFFPVSGLRHWISLYAHGSEGCYWSRSLYVFSDGISGARYLDFRSDYVGMDCSSSSTDGLAAGFTVRPVAK